MKHSTGIKELELVNVEWQVNHHLAKQAYRQQIVDDLHLKPGDLVLDLGCGPGLWSSMFAEKVKPNGRVIGVDIDSRWIDYAVENLEHNPLKDIIEYRIDDINNLSFKDETFDLVYISGCSPYFANINSVLKKQKIMTKKGGRIVES